MLRRTRALFAILIVSAFFLGAIPASAEHVDPTAVAGDPTCADAFPGTFELLADPAGNGQFSDGRLTVTISSFNGFYANWTASDPVQGVIVHGIGGSPRDPGASNVYDYGPAGETADDDAEAPERPRGDVPVDHIRFCYTSAAAGGLGISKTVTPWNARSATRCTTSSR